MRTEVNYLFWQEDEAWLGYLQEYPDYWTQGESLDDLIEHRNHFRQPLVASRPGQPVVQATPEPSSRSRIESDTPAEPCRIFARNTHDDRGSNGRSSLAEAVATA